MYQRLASLRITTPEHVRERWIQFSESLPVSAMVKSVSVIVPTHNGSEFLGQALESILTQTLLPGEVIVVDDASTDGTADIVTAIARRAPVPVRLLRLAENSGGPARPINTGIRAAGGQFIAICDQDDRFCAHKLEQEILLLEQNPNLVSVAALAGRHDRPDEPVLPDSEIQMVRQAGEARDGYTELPGPVALWILLAEGMFPRGYPGFLFRQREWKRKGGVDESLRISSDYEFMCWLATQGPVAFVPRIHYLRRLHAGNLSNQRLATLRDTLEVKRKYLTQNPWLLKEKNLAHKLREDFFSLGFKAREQGRYWDAWRSLAFSMRMLGLDRKTLFAAFKLLPHWLIQKWRGGTHS